MKLRLTVRYPSGHTAPFEVMKPTTTVGRAPECDLCVADTAPATSWEHVRFELSPQGAFVTDLGSSNGTFVNGIRIAARTPLSVADEVRLSQTGPVFRVDAIDLAVGPPPLPVPSVPVWVRDHAPEPASPPPRPVPAPPRPPTRPAPEPTPAGRRIWPLVVGGATAFAVVGGLVVGLIAYRAKAYRQRADEAALALVAAEERRAAEEAQRRAAEAAARRIQEQADEREAGRLRAELAEQKRLADRRLADEEAARKAEPPPPPAPVLTAEEKAQWLSAQLVLSNPAGICIGVTVDAKAEPPVVRLCAKSDNNPHPGPLHVAWDHMIPALTQDRLTVRLFNYKVGDALTADDATEVLARLRPTPLLPTGKEIVAFELARGGVKRTHVGYLMAEDKGKKWTVCPLVPRPVPPGSKAPFPFEVETVPMQEMVATTVRRGLTRSDVKLRADFLDYALNEILQKLEAAPRDPFTLPVRPCLYVHPTVVHADLVNAETERLRAAMEETDDARIQATKDAIVANQRSGLAVSGRGFWGVLVAGSMMMTDRMARLRTAKELNATLRGQYDARYKRYKDDHDHLLNLHDASRLLDMELRTKLVHAGIPLVDGPADANGFVRAGAMTLVRPKADDAVADGLVTATHVLVPEIQRVQSTGEYHLALRLVNQQTPNTVDVAADGDRALRLTGRSGIYRNDQQKLVLRVTETGPDIRVALWWGQSPKMRKFELTGTRSRDNQVEVTSCVIALKGDPRPRYEYHTEARLEILGDKQIKLRVKAAVLWTTDRSGRRVPTTTTDRDFTDIVLTKDDGP